MVKILVWYKIRLGSHWNWKVLTTKITCERPYNATISISPPLPSPIPACVFCQTLRCLAVALFLRALRVVQLMVMWPCRTDGRSYTSQQDGLKKPEKSGETDCDDVLYFQPDYRIGSFQSGLMEIKTQPRVEVASPSLQQVSVNDFENYWTVLNLT